MAALPLAGTCDGRLFRGGDLGSAALRSASRAVGRSPRFSELCDLVANAIQLAISAFGSSVGTGRHASRSSHRLVCTHRHINL